MDYIRIPRLSLSEELKKVSIPYESIEGGVIILWTVTVSTPEGVITDLNFSSINSYSIGTRGKFIRMFLQNISDIYLPSYY